MSVSGFEPNATVPGCTRFYNVQSRERVTNGPIAQMNNSLTCTNTIIHGIRRASAFCKYVSDRPVRGKIILEIHNVVIMNDTYLQKKLTKQ